MFNLSEGRGKPPPPQLVEHDIHDPCWDAENLGLAL